MKSITIVNVAIVTLLGFVSSVYATDDMSYLSSYKTSSFLEEKQVTIPTIMELGAVSSPFIIIDSDNQKVPVHGSTKEVNLLPETVLACKESSYCSQEVLLLDRDQTTWFDFQLEHDGLNKGSIRIVYSNPITTNKVIFETTKDSYTPDSFSLYADGVLVLSNSKIDTVFPQMTAKEFLIRFNYDKPIRFTEVGVGYDITTASAVRFVYLPGKKYTIYTNGAPGAAISPRSAANLFDTKQPFEMIKIGQDLNNPLYKEGDADMDMVPDGSDNCKYVKNTDQKDSNNNKVGDSCDDYDYDGVVTFTDNCKEQYNPDQRDTDSDGLGDVCDSEESRITEKYTWLPWLSIAIVFLAVGFMGYNIYSSINKNKQQS